MSHGQAADNGAVRGKDSNSFGLAKLAAHSNVDRLLCRYAMQAVAGRNIGRSEGYARFCEGLSLTT